MQTLDGKADLLSPNYSIRTNGFIDWASAGNGRFRLPRYTTAERDALTTMQAGDMIYNTTTNKINFFNGTSWEAVTSS